MNAISGLYGQVQQAVRAPKLDDALAVKGATDVMSSADKPVRPVPEAPAVQKRPQPAAGRLDVRV